MTVDALPSQEHASMGTQRLQRNASQRMVLDAAGFHAMLPVTAIAHDAHASMTLRFGAKLWAAAEKLARSEGREVITLGDMERAAASIPGKQVSKYSIAGNLLLGSVAGAMVAGIATYAQVPGWVWVLWTAALGLGGFLLYVDRRVITRSRYYQD